jgi:hypothetical protein
MLIRKYSRRTIYLAAFGLLVTAGITAFLMLTDSYPRHELRTPLLIAFLVFCPPSLLSALIIDAETGTSGFYFVWFFVAVINAVLYAAAGGAVAGFIGFVRRRQSQ